MKGLYLTKVESKEEQVLGNMSFKFRESSGPSALRINSSAGGKPMHVIRMVRRMLCFATSPAGGAALILQTIRQQASDNARRYYQTIAKSVRVASDTADFGVGNFLSDKRT